MNDPLSEQPIRRAALTIAVLTSFITPFMGSAVNIALPEIGREFQANAVLLSWVATAYLLAAAVALVPCGKWSDLHGRKRVFTYGIATYTITSIAAAAAVSVPMLVVCRVLQGIGSAMIFATGMAILISVYPPSERGRVLGINVASVYIGLSLGPFLGGLLTEWLSWRSVFIVTLPLALVVIWLIFTRLKREWAEAAGERFDLAGTLLYGVSLIALILGFSSLPETRGVWLVGGGLVGLAAFIWWELRSRSPVFEVRLFRHNRVFAFSNLAALINYSATFGVTFLLSLYLQYIKALSARQAGLILVCQPIMQAVFSPVAGRLSDKIEPRLVASFGMALTTAGLALFISLGMETPTGILLVGLALLGLGFAFFSSPNTNAIMSSVERRFYGIASGAVGTMRLLGQMLSMGMVTLLFTLLIGKVQITPEHYPSFVRSVRLAFLIFAILCFLGIGASLARGKMHGQPPTPRGL